MRVSSAMLTRQAMENIESSYNKLSKAHTQVSTGKKYIKASESPIEASRVNRLKMEQQEIYKYFSNIDNSRVIVDDTEIALRDINESIQRVKELASNANNGALSLEDREAICIEIEQCKEQIVANLNATSNGKYIFGGYNSKFSPITGDAGAYEYNETDLIGMTTVERDDYLSESVVVNVNEGVQINLMLSALEVIGYGEDNLLNNIDNIITQLKTEPLDTDNLEIQMDIFNNHFDNVLKNVTKIGATTNRLDSIKAQLERKDFAIKTKISNVEDIDVEEAILNYKLAEQAYNSTLMISGKTIQLSLMDYMR